MTLLLNEFYVWNSVVVEQVPETTSSVKDRILVDCVIQKYPFVHACLSASASIIENPTFEAAIMTVMCVNEIELQPDELNSIWHIRTESITEFKLSMSERLSFTQSFSKRSKTNSNSMYK